jgi:hypothetical protein
MKAHSLAGHTHLLSADAVDTTVSSGESLPSWSPTNELLMLSSFTRPQIRNPSTVTSSSCPKLEIPALSPALLSSSYTFLLPLLLILTRIYHKTLPIYTSPRTLALCSFPTRPGSGLLFQSTSQQWHLPRRQLCSGLFFFFFLAVLRLELRAYTLSHSATPSLWLFFFLIFISR